MAITASRVMIYQSCWGGGMPPKMMARRLFVWDWKTGDLVMLLQFYEPQFVQFTSSGTRTIIHGREKIGHIVYAGRLPRRISNSGFTQPIGYHGVGRVQHARSTGCVLGIYND